MRLFRKSRFTDVWSTVSVNGKRLTWRELAEERAEELSRQARWASICSDLDRCEHGRHGGDVCDGCKGSSHGNPLLLATRQIGFDIGGRPIRVPERSERTDPAAWKPR